MPVQGGFLTPFTSPCALAALFPSGSTVPQGSYFVMVNTKRLHLPDDYVVPDIVKKRTRDWQLAFFVAQTAGV